MISAQRLSRVFVEVADTLVADFDLIEFLHKLAEHTAAVSDAASVGLVLADEDGRLHFMAASTESARHLELFQLQQDEGTVPGLLPHRTAGDDRRPVGGRPSMAGLRGARLRGWHPIGACLPDASARPGDRCIERLRRGPDAVPPGRRQGGAGVGRHRHDRDHPGARDLARGDADRAAPRRAQQPDRDRAGKGHDRAPPRGGRRPGLRSAPRTRPTAVSCASPTSLARLSRDPPTSRRHNRLGRYSRSEWSHRATASSRTLTTSFDVEEIQVTETLTASASPQNARSLYTNLASEIRDSGLLGRRYAYYWTRITATVGAFAGLWIGFFLLGDSWLQLLLAGAMGVVMTQFGFLGHDAAHRQMFRSGAWNTGASRALAGLAGLSHAWWRGKHNAHHAAPNQETRDPDIAPGLRRLHPRRDRTAADWAHPVAGPSPGLVLLPVADPGGAQPARLERAAGIREGHVPSTADRGRAGGRTAGGVRRRAAAGAAPRHGGRVHRGAVRDLRPVPGWLVRAQPHRDADRAGNREDRLPTSPGPDVAQRARRAVGRLRTGWPQLPDRAPPVPEHASPESPACAPDRACLLRRAPGELRRGRSLRGLSDRRGLPQQRRAAGAWPVRVPDGRAAARVRARRSQP